MLICMTIVLTITVGVISMARNVWPGRRAAEKATDGCIGVIQVHEGLVMFSTDAPNVQSLHL